MNNLILELTSGFLGLQNNDIDAGIEGALAQLGRFCEVDRVYLFLYRDQHSRVDNTHEWCNENINREIDNLQDIPVQEELPWVNKRVLASETLDIHDLSQLPAQAHFEKKHFEAQNIKSLLVVPVQDNKEILGFLGFDSVKEHREWSNHEIDLLKVIANNLGFLLYRKKTDKDLRESEKKFRKMAELSPLAIYTSSGIEEIGEYVNPTFVKLFGYTLDDVPSVQHWWPLAYPDQEYYNVISKEWRRRVAHAIEKKSTIEPLETIVTCRDKSKRNILWGFSSIGKQNWTFGLDLTEQKLAEQKLEDLVHQLQDKNAEQERFVYTVSHDLKSPLVTISGFCEIIKEQLSSGDIESCQNNLVFISNAAKRMQQLLGELLDISRAGVKVDPSETLNLGVLINEALENVQGVISENETTVEVEPSLPDVIVDKKYFLQVIENLVVNASRYSRSAEESSLVSIGVARDAEKLTCYVKDNGVGIEAQHLEKIFGLFETLETDR